MEEGKGNYGWTAQLAFIKEGKLCVSMFVYVYMYTVNPAQVGPIGGKANPSYLKVRVTRGIFFFAYCTPVNTNS